jgi:hypothetical protein
MIPVALILTLCVAFSAVGPGGAFPLNDDWVYALAAIKTLESSQFTVIGPESAWAIPQTLLSAVWIKIFGFSPFKLRILTLLVASAGLFGFDRLLLLRNANVFTRIVAGLCLIGFFPYLPLTASSMTDLYFFTLWIYACLALELALQNNKGTTWAIGGLALLLCSLQRQFGVVIAIALLFCWYRSRSAPLGKVISVCLASVIPVCVTTVFWSHVPNVTPVDLIQFPSISQRIGNIFCVVLYLGVGVLPLLVMCLLKKHKKLNYDSIGFLLLVVIGTLFIAPLNFRGYISNGAMPFFGNLLSRHGMFMEGEVLNGTREILFSGLFWKFYTVLAIAGATFIVHELFLAKNKLFTNGSLTSIASLLYLAVVVITRNPLFDRYLLPVYSGLLLYLATSLPLPSSRGGRICAIGGAISLIVFSTVITQDFFRWNEAKWKAAEWSKEQGYTADMIDGGYEWNGWHQYTKANPIESLDKRIIISFSELDGTTTLKSFPYDSWIRKGTMVSCLLR